MENRILVLGAGVSGLTTADVLLQQGYEVTLLAEHDATMTPSVVAGALWEWQPAVCGHHRDPTSLARSKIWCMVAYDRFRDLADDPRAGVSMRRACFYFHRAIEEVQKEYRKMLDLREQVDGFRRDAGLIAANGVNPDLGLTDAYEHQAPIIDTQRYTHFLRDRLHRHGCQFVRRRVEGTLANQLPDLLHEFQCQVLVNCAGIGAAELAQDQMYPLRGALVRMVNDGHAFPQIRDAHCITLDETRSDQHLIYLVPRGHNHLLLGGFAQPNEWETDLNLENSLAVRDILERCCTFMPALRQGTLDASPVLVGLRPSREGDVRLEIDADLPIVHNYGHGGSGFSLSWGCAEEVAHLVQTRILQPN